MEQLKRHSLPAAHPKLPCAPRRRSISQTPLEANTFLLLPFQLARVLTAGAAC